jgi:hypothetical protein
MQLLDYILLEPRYKLVEENGDFVKPSISQIMSEYFYRLNFFRNKRNLFPFSVWFLICILIPILPTDLSKV